MGRLLGTAATARVLGKVSRSRHPSRFYGMEQISRAYNIRYKKIDNPNAAEFVESVRHRSPDLIVSVACPYILKSPLLSLPSRGCINIHHAPLPRYKGMMPTFWQMFQGEKSVGVTIHSMASKVDEGAVLLQETLEIEPKETLHHLIQRSKRHGAHCMARVLRQIPSSSQAAFSPDSAKGSYFTFPTIAEIREFHRRGFRAI
jgi:methionyl-tRNA formyltransferase